MPCSTFTEDFALGKSVSVPLALAALSGGQVFCLYPNNFPIGSLMEKWKEIWKDVTISRQIINDHDRPAQTPRFNIVCVTHSEFILDRTNALKMLRESRFLIMDDAHAQPEDQEILCTWIQRNCPQQKKKFGVILLTSFPRSGAFRRCVFAEEPSTKARLCIPPQQ